MTNSKTQITAVILTYNEEIHIARAITNLKGWTHDIFILDSFSSDRTVEICNSLGVRVYQRAFDNYKNQRLYAINELPISTSWMLFLDADEYLLPELIEEIQSLDLASTGGPVAYSLRRRFYFLNTWIKHGGYYPTYLVRLFQKDLVTIDREINEHIIVNGEVKVLKHDFIDHNLKPLKFWFQKHVDYAYREALHLGATQSANMHPRLFGPQNETKLWIRLHVWQNLPPFLRPFLYFCYRVVCRMGFLDGGKGLFFHFIHCIWFLILIDAIYVFEIKPSLQSSETSEVV